MDLKSPNDRDPRSVPRDFFLFTLLCTFRNSKGNKHLRSVRSMGSCALESVPLALFSASCSSVGLRSEAGKNLTDPSSKAPRF